MKSIALCALLTPVVAGGGLALWPQAPSSALPSPSMRQAAVVALAEHLSRRLDAVEVAALETAYRRESYTADDGRARPT